MRLMYRISSFMAIVQRFLLVVMPVLALVTVAARLQQVPPPTLEDWWEGKAEWVVDAENVGLPVG